MISDLDFAESVYTFSVTGQSIAAASTWDLVLDVGELATCAIIQAWIQELGTLGEHVQRKSIHLVATDNIDDCYAQANKHQTLGFSDGVNQYTNVSWRYDGFSYSTDARLSDGDYATDGAYIQAKYAYIDGTDVIIRFENLSSGHTKILTIEGKVRLEKARLVV